MSETSNGYSYATGRADYHQLLTMGGAADYVRERTRRPCGPNSVWRWGRKGQSGVKLELMRVGRVFYTTAEALETFWKALAEAKPLPRPEDYATRRQPTRRAVACQNAAERVRTEKVLQEAGLK